MAPPRRRNASTGLVYYDSPKLSDYIVTDCLYKQSVDKMGLEAFFNAVAHDAVANLVDEAAAESYKHKDSYLQSVWKAVRSNCDDVYDRTRGCFDHSYLASAGKAIIQEQLVDKKIAQALLDKGVGSAQDVEGYLNVERTVRAMVNKAVRSNYKI